MADYRKDYKRGDHIEVYSRVTGYFRPVNSFNVGKREEFKERLAYNELDSIASEFAK